MVYVDFLAHMLYFLLTKTPLFYSEILNLMVIRAGFWDHNIPTGQPPRKTNLCHCLAVFFSQITQHRVLHQLKRSILMSFTIPTNWTVGHRHDSLLHQPIDKLLLRTLRVKLDLVAGRLDLTVGEHICEQLDIEIRDANATSHLLLHK